MKSHATPPVNIAPKLWNRVLAHGLVATRFFTWGFGNSFEEGEAVDPNKVDKRLIKRWLYFDVVKVND